MSRVDQKNCTCNLLRFYNTLAADKRPELVNKPEVMEYAVAVSGHDCVRGVPVYSSGMNLNKSAMRSSMNDSTCVAVLKARELTTVFAETYTGAMEGRPKLDFERALRHNLE